MTEVSHSPGPPAVKSKVFQVPDTQQVKFLTYYNLQGKLFLTS